MRRTMLGFWLTLLTGVGCQRVDPPAPAGPVVKSAAVTAAPPVEEDPSCCAEPTSTTTAGPEVTLKVVKLEALKQVIASEPGKVILVDVWADFCVPCKKEFPHLVALHKKHGGDNLVCLSACVDEPDERERSLKFLKKQGATFANYLLDDPAEVWQDYWNIKAIPAVFLYRDGKEIARFDFDDPDKQFTYADVEKTLAALLVKK